MNIPEGTPRHKTKQEILREAGYVPGHKPKLSEEGRADVMVYLPKHWEALIKDRITETGEKMSLSRWIRDAVRVKLFIH
jgi:hypothetical protein